MKIKIIWINPHVKPEHIKHAAGLSTIMAGATEMLGSMHFSISATLFVIGGCLAIYDPHLVHEANLKEENHDDNG